jgi:hypothetical protein
MEALRHRVDRVSDEEIKSRLEEEFDVHDLVRRQAANEPVDVDEVLDMWADRKDSGSYPYVLYRLVNVDDTPLPSHLAAAIDGVLEHFRSYLDQSGISLLGEKLALRFSRRARKSPAAQPEFDEQRLVTVLRSTHEEWSGLLSVNTNINVLEFLRERDPSRSHEYETELGYWRAERLRILEERDLPHWISTGRYVLLMLTYVETLGEYGLKATRGGDDRLLDWTGKMDAKSAHALLRSAAARPFLDIGGKRVLNAQFLQGAQKLFWSDLSKDAQYDDIRYEFNNAAKESMQQLFTFLIDLNGIPKAIREILERHEKMVRSRLAIPTSRDPSLVI